MSRRAWWEVPHGRYPGHRRAVRSDRGRILDEFREATGYQRKYALRLLNGPLPRTGSTSTSTPGRHVCAAGDPSVDDDLGGGRVSTAEGAAAVVALCARRHPGPCVSWSAASKKWDTSRRSTCRHSRDGD
jgi:hypothetical protein